MPTVTMTSESGDGGQAATVGSEEQSWLMNSDPREGMEGMDGMEAYIEVCKVYSSNSTGCRLITELELN